MAVFPDYYLGPFEPVVPTPTTAPIPPQQRPRLPRSCYAAIAERARYESLRDLAAEYGVSHETIRAIVRRVGAATAQARPCSAARRLAATREETPSLP
jgi:hypothetical protein